MQYEGGAACIQMISLDLKDECSVIVLRRGGVVHKHTHLQNHSWCRVHAMLHAGPGDCERLCCDVYTAPLTVALNVEGRARMFGGHSGCGVRAGGDGG